MIDSVLKNMLKYGGNVINDKLYHSIVACKGILMSIWIKKRKKVNEAGRIKNESERENST